MSYQDLVIIGSGLGGYTLAREFRKLSPGASITMITRDGGDFYAKPNLSNALSAGKNPDSLVTKTADAMAESLAMTIRRHCHVEGIDPNARTVRTSEGDLAFRSLVFAVGADQGTAPMGGDAVDRVLQVNDLDDYRRFREALAPGANVLIIGAGLIGCEFANDLAAAGYSVVMVDPAAHPLARLVPAEAGTLFQSGLERIGVDCRMGRTVSTLSNRPDGGLVACLNDGASVEADLVVSAIGLHPRTGLARAAGLEIGRGIRVDSSLRTSTDPIYAVGDCAEIEGRILPYVQPLMVSAKALARTLSGQPTQIAWPPMPVTVKTPSFPLIVEPPTDTEGAWSMESAEDAVVGRFVTREGKLAGYVLGGSAIKRKQDMVREWTDGTIPAPTPQA